MWFVNPCSWDKHCFLLRIEDDKFKFRAAFCLLFLNYLYFVCNNSNFYHWKLTDIITDFVFQNNPLKKRKKMWLKITPRIVNIWFWCFQNPKQKTRAEENVDSPKSSQACVPSDNLLLLLQFLDNILHFVKPRKS